MAKQVTGAFTEAGQSATRRVRARASLSLSGFGAGTIVLERSFNGGATWVAVESYIADYEGIVEGTGELYRLNCTVYTAGTLAYVLGDSFGENE